MSFQNPNGKYIREYLEDKEYAQDEFELIQDELDIDNIEELYINASRVGENQNNSWLGRNLDVVMVKKINELVQALKQINQNKED